MHLLSIENHGGCAVQPIGEILHAGTAQIGLSDEAAVASPGGAGEDGLPFEDFNWPVTCFLASVAGVGGGVCDAHEISW